MTIFHVYKGLINRNTLRTVIWSDKERSTKRGDKCIKENTK